MELSLSTLRKKLHKEPELSGQEKNTHAQIISYLRQFPKFSIIRNIGGYGVLAELKGEKPGPNILLRADIDALPIQEKNTSISYSSKTKGVAHLCGHDGHIAILLGVAKHYAKHGFQKGKLSLLFQAEEETGKGASKVFTELQKRKFPLPDFAFALHNIPTFKHKNILCKKGSFTSSVVSCEIYFEGKASHASAPQNGNNPAYAISSIIQRIKEMENPDQKSPSFSLITPIHINVGDIAYGTAAGNGEMHITLRTRSNAKTDVLKLKIQKEIESICTTEGLKYSLNWLEEFRAVENHPSAVNTISLAANSLNLEYLDLEFPFDFGEDFGLFTENIPGAMFGIGAGEKHPQLHNPDYDFPDSIIETGIDMFVEIVKQSTDK
ncbi:MAG: amidohydrolase [Bacteroidales bacterium]